MARDSLHIQYETPGAPGGGIVTPPVQPPVPPVAPPAQPPAAPPAQQQAAQQPPPAAHDGLAAMSAEELVAEVLKLRKENMTYRTRSRDTLKLVAQLTGEDVSNNAAPPDLATLTKRIEQVESDRKAEVRALKLDSALKDVYVKHGVHPDLTAGLLRGNRLLDDLDVDAADFGRTLDGKVKDLVTSYPQLKTTASPPPPGPNNGARFPGGTNGTPQLSRADLQSMTPEEINAAREAGQLDALLGRRPKT